MKSFMLFVQVRRAPSKMSCLHLILSQEREALGRYLCNAVLEAVNYDIPNSVFSFIPNSAETAFVGLVQVWS